MSCPVCLELIDKVGYIIFKCGHSMHSDCFQSFINTTLNCCPLCRSKDIPQVNENLKDEINSLKKERDNLRYIAHEEKMESEALIQENQIICSRYTSLKKRYNQLNTRHNNLQEEFNQNLDKRKARAFEKICDSNKITKRRKNIYLALLEANDSMSLKGLLRSLRTRFSSTTIRKDLKEMEQQTIVNSSRSHTHFFSAQ